MRGPVLRDERAADRSAIGHVIEAAFAGHPHSDGSEARIVEDLRAAGALAVSLVAVEGGEIVGHVAFSAVQIGAESPGWFALGPLAVVPERQGEGIGIALVKAGLARLVVSGARGCTLVGDPGYYARFGFAHDPGVTCRGIPPEFVLIRAFERSAPAGAIRHHAAFGLDP